MDKPRNERSRPRLYLDPGRPAKSESRLVALSLKVPPNFRHGRSLPGFHASHAIDGDDDGLIRIQTTATLLLSKQSRLLPWEYVLAVQRTSNRRDHQFSLLDANNTASRADDASNPFPIRRSQSRLCASSNRSGFFSLNNPTFPRHLFLLTQFLKLHL